MLRLLNTIAYPYSSGSFREILTSIEKCPDSFVFFTHSRFGRYASKVKKLYPNAIVVVFFHNVEISMSWKRFKLRPRCYEALRLIKLFCSEWLICKYADYVLPLNNRDANLLHKIYHCKVAKQVLLPMSIIDRNGGKLIVKKKHGILRLLFVGTYFWGNIPGLISFIEHVMPKVEGRVVLDVVGNGMEQIKNNVVYSNNVNFVGFVDDMTLDNYYRNADIFIAPITDGGGMKTKIAEAMMFGLPIIGTKEAFTGYDVEFNKIGICSDKEEDYVTFILKMCNSSEMELQEMSLYSRNCYDKNYSLRSTVDILKKIAYEK